MTALGGFAHTAGFAAAQRCLRFVVVVVLCSEAQDYADLNDAIFVETSAKTAVNVSALFLEISMLTLCQVHYLQHFDMDFHLQWCSGVAIRRGDKAELCVGWCR